MEIGGKDYYVYVKNLSSAYFKTRPDTTRAQLPVKEDFDEIKHSIIPFVFLGYDRINDVLVCWNHHIAKQRLNERKSVSFYSRSFFQEEVVSGEFLKKNLKMETHLFFLKGKILCHFFVILIPFRETNKRFHIKIWHSKQWQDSEDNG